MVIKMFPATIRLPWRLIYSMADFDDMVRMLNSIIFLLGVRDKIAQALLVAGVQW